jgi:hypothetical protein
MGEWEELEARLDEWKVALKRVLASDQIAALKEHEQHQVGTSGGTTTVTTTCGEWRWASSSKLDKEGKGIYNIVGV